MEFFSNTRRIILTFLLVLIFFKAMQVFASDAQDPDKQGASSAHHTVQEIGEPKRNFKFYDSGGIQIGTAGKFGVEYSMLFGILQRSTDESDQYLKYFGIGPCAGRFFSSNENYIEVEATIWKGVPARYFGGVIGTGYIFHDNHPVGRQTTISLLAIPTVPLPILYGRYVSYFNKPQVVEVGLMIKTLMFGRNE